MGWTIRTENVNGTDIRIREQSTPLRGRDVQYEIPYTCGRCGGTWARWQSIPRVQPHRCPTCNAKYEGPAPVDLIEDAAPKGRRS